VFAVLKYFHFVKLKETSIFLLCFDFHEIDPPTMQLLVASFLYVVEIHHLTNVHSPNSKNIVDGTAVGPVVACQSTIVAGTTLSVRTVSGISAAVGC
jgi:hypothetical protein